MDDIRAVMDAAGSERAAIVGFSEGGTMSALFAASYPSRTTALIAYSAFPRRMWAPDIPWGRSETEVATHLDQVERLWAQGAKSVELYAPSFASNEQYRRASAQAERAAATPRAAVDLLRMNMEFDLSGILASVRVPTLVLHRAGTGRSRSSMVAISRRISLAPSMSNCRVTITFHGPGKLTRSWTRSKVF